jgi:hypothetical protein
MILRRLFSDNDKRIKTFTNSLPEDWDEKDEEWANKLKKAANREDKRKRAHRLIGSGLVGTGAGLAGSILGGIYAYKHRYDKIDWDDAENSLTGKYDYDYKKFIMPKQNILPRDFIKLMGNQKKFIPEIIKEYVITKNPSSNLNIPVIGSLAPIYNGSKDIFLLKMANSDNAIFYNMDTRTYNYGSDKSFKSLKDILNDYYKNKENKDRLSREYIKHVNRVL